MLFSTLIMYYHVFNVIIVIFVSLPFILFYCCCFSLSLLMSLLLHIVFCYCHHFFCSDHYYRCQSGCCYYYCYSYHMLLLPILHHSFVLFYGFLISPSLIFTLNFCNYSLLRCFILLNKHFPSLTEE